MINMFQPKTFQELIDNEANLPELIASNGNLNRSETCQNMYKAFLLSFEKDKHIDNIKKEMNSLSVAIVPNNFPYDNFLKNLNVQHYVLWIDYNSMLNKFYKLSRRDIEDYCRIAFGGRQFVFFKNLAKNQSVPEIEHYHIFSEFK